MKVKVEMAGGKGKVSFDMELEPENVTFDGMQMTFDKALEAYKELEETEMIRMERQIMKSGAVQKALSEVAKKSYKELSNARPLGTFARDQKMNYINGLKNKKSELAVFPEWCKVGEWVYSPCCCDPDKGTYFKVTQIDDVCIIGEENVCHVDNAVRARLRPYNSDEMKALVGKVIEDDEGCFVVMRYIKRFDMIYNDKGYPLDSEQLIKFEYTLDGKPCGVLEHLNENGEWVE